MHEYDESEFPELAGQLREALSPPPLDRAGEARELAFLKELQGVKVGAAGNGGRILGLSLPTFGGLLALAAALMLTFFLIRPGDRTPPHPEMAAAPPALGASDPSAVGSESSGLVEPEKSLAVDGASKSEVVNGAEPKSRYVV